jgi:hypothetical protein
MSLMMKRERLLTTLRAVILPPPNGIAGGCLRTSEPAGVPDPRRKAVGRPTHSLQRRIRDD